MSTSNRQNSSWHMRRMGISRSSRRQQGAVLVVGLIILVVLTLLGVQGMRTNVAQERMAANMRERNVAFQAAEAALRVGEMDGAFDGSGADLADPFDWTPGPDRKPTEGIEVLGFSGGEAFSDPRYNVGPPQYVRIGLTLPPEFRLIYPVVSIGVGAQEGSVVVLQSGFEPPN